jgi:hypothetical protein
LGALPWEQFDERERARVGDQAEMYVRQVISSHGEGTLFRGPLVPNIDNRGCINGYREADFLVYTQGTVFCIEVKYYSGTITYLPIYRPQQIWNGYSYSQQNVFCGYDDSRILQVKQGRRRELIEETYPNPLKKTKNFISLLKKYVGRVEPRFQRLFLIPVVCFGEKADIRAIYDFQGGIIHIEHLPMFFDQHRHPQFATKPSSWITETILNKIPNWDRVQTASGEWVNGILVEPCLTFVGQDGISYRLSNYSTIKSIYWQSRHRAPSTQMTVTYTNGATQVFSCGEGQISLVRGGQPQI